MTDLNRDQLIRVLGMLGSSEVGERDNAATLAHKMVRSAGLTWEELFEASSAAAEHARTLEIERYRLRIEQLERELEAARSQIRQLTDELARVRASLRQETSAARQPSWSPQKADSTQASKRPANWGADIFGDEPALHPAATPLDNSLHRRRQLYEGPRSPQAASKKFPIAVRVVFWIFVLVVVTVLVVEKGSK